MIKVLAKPNSRIKLGRLGENEHRMICFPDTAELLQMYPEAEITLLHQRPTDPAGYPVNPDCVTVADGMVCWPDGTGLWRDLLTGAGRNGYKTIRRRKNWADNHFFSEIIVSESEKRFFRKNNQYNTNNHRESS